MVIFIIVFGCSVGFINYIENNTTSRITATEIIDNNIISLASSDKRSNGARYALIKSNLRIAVENPLLGVGKGLAAAYIVDHYTDSEKKNGEVSKWIKYQEERGVFASGYSMGGALNEYVTRLAQCGIVGLSIFLFPFVWVILKLFHLYKKSENGTQIDVLLVLFTLISCLVAGCNLSINEFYSIWILLGIAFAIVYSEKDNLNKCE